MRVRHESGDLTDGKRRLVTLLHEGKLIILEVGEGDGMLEVDLSDGEARRALEEFAEGLLRIVRAAHN
jgi:hypothetical protein